MARKTINQAGAEAAESGFLDLVGDEKVVYNKPIKFKSIKDTLDFIAGKYVIEIRKAIKNKDAISSGKMSESVKALEVEVMGSIYTVSIEANKYLSYVDEGVDGWDKKRGSRFKFKKPKERKKGEEFTGESPMVNSVMEWLTHEGKMNALQVRPITKREKRRAKITDTSKRAAIRATYMIKRFGLKPKGFMDQAKKNMDKVIEKEIGAALKIDIINNIVS